MRFSAHTGMHLHLGLGTVILDVKLLLMALMPTVPKLTLSHGQVLYALARGQNPDAVLIDQLRYLRQSGVPFDSSELGTGRGNRVSYRFKHLAELGVAVFALRRGLKPREVAGYLTKHRNELRTMYRKAFRDQPDGALTNDWVKSRGRIVPGLANEIFLRLHDRYSETPGKFEVVGPDKAADRKRLFEMVEHYPGEQARMLVPLTRLVLELVAWALEAPPTRPGRQ